MRYASIQDIDVTIQLLKISLTKIAKFPDTNKKLAPRINRVIMELEDISKLD